MTSLKDIDAAVVRESGVLKMLTEYAGFINARPPLLSVLYDIDLLPGQVLKFSDAVRLAALCEVWKKGEVGDLPPSATPSPGNSVDIAALADRIAAVDPDNLMDAGELAGVLGPYVGGLVSAAARKQAETADLSAVTDYVSGAMGVSL